MEPQEVNDVDLAFGGKVKQLMPPYEEIPEEFHRTYGYWQEWQSEWFFRGLKDVPKAKDGIDGKKAMRHLAAIQRSFEPKHEYKHAAVAYLASLWFEQPKTKAKT